MHLIRWLNIAKTKFNDFAVELNKKNASKSRWKAFLEVSNKNSQLAVTRENRIKTFTYKKAAEKKVWRRWWKTLRVEIIEFLFYLILFFSLLFFHSLRRSGTLRGVRIKVLKLSHKVMPLPKMTVAMKTAGVGEIKREKRVKERDRARERKKRGSTEWWIDVSRLADDTTLLKFIPILYKSE